LSAHRGACWALVVGFAAFAPCCVATAAAKKGHRTGCKAGQITLRYSPHGHRKPPWCLRRVGTPRGEAAAALAIERQLGSGGLAPKRLRRLVRHLPARAERRFDRVRARQLRSSMLTAGLARATGAHAASGTDRAIPPGPDQAGFGFENESSSSSTSEDSERSTVRTTKTSKSRHEVFGPKCPDANGDVVTKIKIVHTSIRSTERRGKRTTITTDARITGSLRGGFDDDFELRGPLTIDLDLVVETRVVTVIALTGKVVDRAGTDTRRFALTGSVGAEAVAATESISDAADASKITGAGGPKGVLTNDDVSEGLAAVLIGSLWLARTEAKTAFAKTVGNATGFKCVAAVATPGGLTLDQGESGTFTVALHGLDDGRALPVSSTSRVFSGSLLLAPTGSRIHGPESGTAFRVTSGGGKSVAEVSTVSRRGYGATLKIPISPRPVFVPPRYGGSYSGTSDLSTGTGPVPLVAAFDGTVVLAPLPATPGFPGAGSRIFYRIESGSVHVHVSGTIEGCTWTADGTVDLLADPGSGMLSPMNLTPTTPVHYSLSLPPPFTASIPGAITGCPDPADDHAISWPVATGLPAVIYGPPDVPADAHGAIAGSYAGRVEPASPIQTWTWNLAAL
jgi:hypothetical protein